MKSNILSFFFIIGSASAAGCHPAYSPDSDYAVSNLVSQSITTVTPLVWFACDVGTNCPTGYTQTGGVSTTATYNYACNSHVWCSNMGFAPGSIYSDLAWTKEATPCSVSCPAIQLRLVRHVSQTFFLLTVISTLIHYSLPYRELHPLSHWLLL